MGPDPTSYLTNQRDYVSPRANGTLSPAGGRADGKPMGGVRHPTALDLNRTKLNLGCGANEKMTNNSANYHWIQPVKKE